MSRTPKGIFVGEFTEADIRDKKDRQAVQAAMHRTGLKYTNTRETKKGIKIWVCALADMEVTHYR